MAISYAWSTDVESDAMMVSIALSGKRLVCRCKALEHDVCDVQRRLAVCVMPYLSLLGNVSGSHLEICVGG